jgi:hypothetical protein
MPNCANRMSFISLQLNFPEVELILKTFTFAPYCYPYASLSTVLSREPSTLNLRPCGYSNTLAPQIHAVPASNPIGSSTIHLKNEKKNLDLYSNRKISTGSIFDAERAGNVVAAILMASAAAAIHKASNPFA